MTKHANNEPCRICGSAMARAFERRHDIECCESCVQWVSGQPVFFPAGTERSQEPVRWWDLQYLYMVRRFNGRVGGVALSTDQVIGALRELYLERTLEKNPIGYDDILIIRFGFKGMCVEWGVHYGGRIEDVAERHLARYTVIGTEERAGVHADADRTPNMCDIPLTDGNCDDLWPRILAFFEARNIKRRLITDLSWSDDWTLVVKGHALIEVLVTELLIKRLGAEEARDVWTSKTELSVRMAHVRALGLLCREDLRFVQALSELRNKLVHDVRQVFFAFDSHIDGLDANQRRSFVDSLCGPLLARTHIDGGGVSRDEVMTNPRLAVMGGILRIVAIACSPVEGAEGTP